MPAQPFMDVSLLRAAAQRRFWRPPSTAIWAISLFMAACLPWAGAWLLTHTPLFERFVGLPFLAIMIATTLVGRFLAGLLSIVMAAGLLAYVENPPLDSLDISRPADLIAMVLFVFVASVVAYALALKDSSAEVAELRQREVADLARQIAIERERNEQILGQMPSGIVAVDPSREPILANRRASEILGLPFGGDPGSVPTGKLLIGAVREDGTPYPDDRDPLTRSLRHGEVARAEIMRLSQPDGEVVVIQADAAPLMMNGSIAGAIFAFQDVTIRVRIEEELASTARRLAQIQRITDVALSGVSFEELAQGLLRIVRTVLEADAATLLMVDPARAGLIEYLTVGLETGEAGIPVPIGVGIAGSIARDARPLVVEDVASHDVARPWLKRTMHSLIGVPLLLRGQVTGVIHVTTRERRTFDDDDVRLLELAAARIASALERATLYEGRAAMATALQRVLIPPSLPEILGLDVASLYWPFTPEDDIGGDFYDVFAHGDGSWGVAVGDVAGKGPGAAAVMGLAAHGLRGLSQSVSRPRDLLEGLNELLLHSERVEDERFCTICQIRISVEGRLAHVVVCSAGHPLPVVVRANGTLRTVGLPGTLLGAFPRVELHEVSLELARGDALLVYTDGLVERRGSAIADGEALLGKILAAAAGEPAAALVERIKRELIDPDPPEDDIAFVVIAKT